jgi:hypothetical protein
MLFNVVIGGPVGQTFSARNWIWKKEGKPNLVWLIDILFAQIDPEHCFHSYLTWKCSKNFRGLSKSINYQIEEQLHRFYHSQE